MPLFLLQCSVWNLSRQMGKKEKERKGRKKGVTVCHDFVLKSHYEKSPENSCKVEMHNKEMGLFIYE